MPYGTGRGVQHLAIAGLSSTLLWCSPAWAQGDPVRLVYLRGPGAESCPEAFELQEGVRARLGFDPFHPSTDRTLMAFLERRSEGFWGRIELLDSKGVPEGSREHLSPADDCGSLLRAMALSISIALDLGGAPETPGDAALADKSQDEPLAQRATETPIVDRTELDADQPAERGWGFGFSVAAHGSWGALPSPALGPAISIQARRHDLSLSVDGRQDLPTTTPIGEGGHLRSRLQLASLAPCVHLDPVFLCAVGAVGLLHVESRGITSPASDSAFLAGVGGRAGAAVYLTDALALRAQADLLATLTRVRVEVDETELWHAPPTSLAASAGVLIHFP